ncbi:hypothetical protein [Synechococcus phage S-B68]|nr:hypothetical protein [Synechococcus phage S-B68]
MCVFFGVVTVSAINYVVLHDSKRGGIVKPRSFGRRLRSVRVRQNERIRSASSYLRPQVAFPKRSGGDER